VAFQASLGEEFGESAAANGAQELRVAAAFDVEM
jgi:hypothetical protein